ncbi:signal recognition particle-docking protein FtsY [Phyllobacterium myrsinacearum]|uniref:Signal recognition particle receptor FtsY n=1 Tax=Phyllobacterium myrsinacearum TaxID=28101 RepID=A0A839EGA9_9HYPH|nr:signal recognition particle-docking protein FtsY [Phyllobacterium myrsinacearum]MBA8877932.1 fused signal recognition particle receptor [Phyllobacterium myrsinacearum]
MALGFIKKIFSFGKKTVEEVPAETPIPALEAPALEAPVHQTTEQVYEDTTAQEALTVPAQVELIEPEPVEAEHIDEPAPAVETVIEQPAETEILVEAEPVVVEPIAVEESPPVVIDPEPEPIAELPQQEAPKPEPVVPAEPETALPELEPVIPPVEEEYPIPLNVAEEPFEQTLAEVLTPPVHVREPEPAAIDVPAPVEPIAPTKPASSKVTVTKTVEEKKVEDAVEVEPEKRLSWFERLRKGLSRSSQQLGDSIGGIFTRRKLDEDTLQDLEDVLIQADLGMETAIRITGSLSATRYGKDISSEEVRAIMATEIEKVLGPVAKPLELDLSHKPHVILVVGVNGTGKTTTIGKLAAKLTAGGLSVMLAAGDTFRAAAIEQLHIWGQRTGAPVVSSKLGADAAGLAFDAWQQAKEAGSDVLIIDTAGRLQNRTELMDELAKIVRVLGKIDPEAPHTVLQTLDATTGQNALNQVEIFKNIAGVNGLVMTKLDGTARGGILVAISAKHKLPVYFIGVGEQVEDLEPFAAKDFAKAIAGVA